MVLPRKWMAILCAMLILVGAFAVFGIRAFTSSDENNGNGLKEWQSSNVTVAYPFMLMITTENDTYKPYETVDMQITLKNIGDENVTIMFMTKGNPNRLWFNMVFDENGKVVFYWKNVGRLQAVDYITFQPNESKGITCTWDQKNTDTGTQVPPGNYYLTAAVGFTLMGDFNGTNIDLKSQKMITILNS